MKPTTADIIDSIIWSLDNYVKPEVQEPFASSVLLTIGNLLRHVKLRAQQEAIVLSEDNADLVAVLHDSVHLLKKDRAIEAGMQQQLDALANALNGAPVAAAPPEAVEQLSNNSDALRLLLDDLIRALGALKPDLQERSEYHQVRQSIRGYLARQLQREGSLITPAFIGGRR